MRPIRERQRVQVPAVAFERVLLHERRPPFGNRRRRLLLDGQLILDLAVERDPPLRRRADTRERRRGKRGDDDGGRGFHRFDARA
jgi:hypothetical protein